VTQIAEKKLDRGETFPNIALSVVNGDDLTLPEDVKGSWTVLLAYRGHW